MTHKVFVDANIFIAGAGSRTGASRSVLNLAEIGLIQLVTSRQVLDEVERNLRRKLPAGLPLMTEWLTNLTLQVVDDPSPEVYSRWLALIEPKDAPILEAAVSAAAHYFLTLNSKDFTPAVATASGLVIQSPAEFIQNVRAILHANL